MSPFLSFLATRSVAHFFRLRFGAAEDVEADVLVLGAELLEIVDREEPLVLLELVEEEPPLDERSSLRLSSPRRSSSPRERELRQSLRPRSPKRLRERSRSLSRPSESDRELPLGDCAWAIGVVACSPPMVAHAIQANVAIRIGCKRDFISSFNPAN